MDVVMIFQIVFAVHRSWLRELGIVEPQQLLDPETNAKAALKLHQLTNQDWTPWCHGSAFSLLLIQQRLTKNAKV